MTSWAPWGLWDMGMDHKSRRVGQNKAVPQLLPKGVTSAGCLGAKIYITSPGLIFYIWKPVSSWNVPGVPKDNFLLGRWLCARAGGSTELLRTPEI